MPVLSALLDEPDEKIAWICNPFVVRHGITFLYGKTTIGKSPLTWELARCVSQGLPFLGWPTSKGKVLYLEADTPKVVIKPRLRMLPEPKGDWWVEFMVGEPLDLCQKGNKVFSHIQKVKTEWGEPDLVIWNVLRQFYRGSGSASEIVPPVYGNMRSCFPHAGHVVVGHDRKSPTDAMVDVSDEDFSGSSAWWDLATVGLHLVQTNKKERTLKLHHTKSQASELIHPISLDLGEDGTQISSHSANQYAQVMELMTQAPEKGDKARWVAEQLGIGRATVFRILER